MISLLPLIELLKRKPAGFKHAWFRKVGSAGSFAQVRAEELPLPAAWIIRSAERSQHAGERCEDLTVGFDVVIAIENAREHYPGESDEILLAYRQAVKTMLLGWEVEADVQPIQFGGGQALEYTDDDIYWRDRYTFDALITNYLPDPPAYSGLTLEEEQP